MLFKYESTSVFSPIHCRGKCIRKCCLKFKNAYELIVKGIPT